MPEFGTVLIHRVIVRVGDIIQEIVDAIVKSVKFTVVGGGSWTGRCAWRAK